MIMEKMPNFPASTEHPVNDIDAFANPAQKIQMIPLHEDGEDAKLPCKHRATLSITVTLLFILLKRYK